MRYGIRKYYSHDHRDFFYYPFPSIRLLLRLLDIEQGQRITFKVAIYNIPGNVYGHC